MMYSYAFITDTWLAYMKNLVKPFPLSKCYFGCFRGERFKIISKFSVMFSGVSDCSLMSAGCLAVGRRASSVERRASSVRYINHES